MRFDRVVFGSALGPACRQNFARRIAEQHGDQIEVVDHQIKRDADIHAAPRERPLAHGVHAQRLFRNIEQTERL